MPTSRAGAGQGQGGGAHPPILTCIMSANDGIIQFPGLLTFSLSINRELPNKYRQIALKTYIDGAHLFKTFSNSEKYP